MTAGHRRRLALIALVALAALLAGCGSSSHHANPGHAATTPPSTASTSQIAQTGPGLDVPTHPTGARVAGGTVTFAEAPGSPPNYIFPAVSAEVCSIANVTNFNALMYRPLYWYGNGYRPTVDYDYSVGDAPVFSDGDRTVTIHLKDWRWSDGERVTARDVAFEIDLYRAVHASDCEYVPGRFPDNVVRVATPSASTLVLHLDASYDPEWFLYNELSQLVPLPLAWDRTSLSQSAPTRDDGHLPDATPAGARAVYRFLDSQSKRQSSWATSPLWQVVDGPWRLRSFTSTGEATLVPNRDWSGTPKPSIARFVELPFTSDTAAFDEIRTGGPHAVTIGYVPAQDGPTVGSLTHEGYLDDRGSMYSFGFFSVNFHNPTVGPVFRQLYARQALQRLVDQPGWISAFLDHAATVTASPVPVAPPSPLVSGGVSRSPYPFSVATAASLLRAHGWKVAPGATSTCARPGSSADECGAGVRRGQPFAFSLIYASGSTALQSEMDNLQGTARRVGISIDVAAHPAAFIYGTAAPCTASQPACRWEAADTGSGWVYADPYLPTGEVLFATGAATNFGSYSDAHADRLIDETISTPASREARTLGAYASYMSTQLPVIYTPTPIGLYTTDAGTLVSDHLGGFSANAFTYLTPEAWYLTR